MAQRYISATYWPWFAAANAHACEQYDQKLASAQQKGSTSTYGDAIPSIMLFSANAPTSQRRDTCDSSGVHVFSTAVCHREVEVTVSMLSDETL